MTTKYECGECTACCKTHGVKSLDKPSQSLCRHCLVNQGCAIYDSRPAECRSFLCSWLIEKGGGEDHRPDKTGIVPVHAVIPEIGMVLILTEFIQGALCSEWIFKWTRANVFRGNFTLHRPVIGKTRLFIPKGAEEPTIDQHDSLERSLEMKIEVVPFESCLTGLVL